METITNFINSIFEKENLNQLNDLFWLKLKGKVQAVETVCFQNNNELEKEYIDSFSKIEYLDGYEFKYNNNIYFNIFGFKNQEVQFKDRNRKIFDYKIFEYFRNNHLKEIRLFDEIGQFVTSTKFKYIRKKNKTIKKSYVKSLYISKEVSFFSDYKDLVTLEKTTYTPNTKTINTIEFNKDTQVIKEHKGFLDTIKENIYNENILIKSNYFISNHIKVDYAIYNYKGDNLVEKKYYRKNDKLYRIDTFINDKMNNWIERKMNFYHSKHPNTIFIIKRKINYYKDLC